MKKIFLSGLILFFAVSGYAQLPNASFETWRHYVSNGDSLVAPDSWFSADSLVSANKALAFGPTYQQMFQSTDKHSGTYAVELVSKTQGIVGVIPGILANAQLGLNFTALLSGDTAGAFTYSGGTPISTRYLSVRAYVKYLPKGSDQALILVQAMHGSDTIGQGALSIASTISTYTQQIVNIDYVNSETPDKILIAFLSSRNTHTAQDGTTLYVDDVSLSTVLGVPQVATENNTVTCYPNPGTGAFHISSTTTEKLHMLIYTASGQQIATKDFSGNDVLDLSNYPSGLYFYNITNTQGAAIQHGKLSLVK
ncbi:MAG TPA: T9SS type A sorting domain-containing protein [Flavipsychrobacter sp.]|nr:T9SS type A sorting domain-containing protein [Flavipsychrobacter sp.]